MKPRLAGAAADRLVSAGPGGGATLKDLVLAADRRFRLPKPAVTIEVVDPYAGRQDTEVEQ